MDSYLLELRIGYARWRLKQNIDHITTKFHLTKESPEVPHLSLYGSFTINSGYNIRDLKKKVEKVAKKYDKLPYYINGWENRKSSHGGVVVHKIDPSNELKQFTIEVVNELLQITTPKNSFDNHPENAWFHSTLAFRLNDSQYNQILRYLGVQSPGILSSVFKIFSNPASPSTGDIRGVYLPVDGLRVTILRNSLIAAEYDFTSKRWLDRPDAKSSRHFGITLKKYRINQGIELKSPKYHPDPTIFTIGDLHLKHANIINYCSRPFLFSQVNEMDQVIIKNWNYTVKPDDYVFFIGDLCCTLDKKIPEQFLKMLNGHITFIEGNHDEGTTIPNRIPFYIHQYHGIDFLFTHYPESKFIPKGFNGWIIHGHTHNNNLKKHPFFDPNTKRVNVGAELVKYQPIHLKYIYDLIKANSRTIRYLE